MIFCCRASPLLQGAHRLRPGGGATLATSGQGPYQIKGWQALQLEVRGPIRLRVPSIATSGQGSYQPKGVKHCNFRSGALSA